MFLQIRGSDGAVLGFCGFAKEERQIMPNLKRGQLSSTMSSPSPSPGTINVGRCVLPQALAISAWQSLSSKLRDERERALSNVGRVCRGLT